MEKQRYYVTVGSGEILPSRTSSEWEFEIDASDEEANHLQRLMEEADLDAMGDFWRAHTPLVAGLSSSGDAYDEDIQNIYEMLYDLGTKETKDHIKSMNILEKK